MKYAVLDWDNTVRNGYTIFGFVEFLIKESVLPISVKQNIDEWDRKYRAGTITHDQYAEYACRDFANSLLGYSVSCIDELAQKYIDCDRFHLFPFAKTIFDFLHKHEIAPIIISGAPLCVLDKYKKELHIHDIFAFDLDTCRGEYTGLVGSNYGYNKEKIIAELVVKYGALPFMGFGDSSSDEPLILTARHGFLISNKLSDNLFPQATFISRTASEADVEAILQSFL